jgi:hypothetical protein
VVTTQTTRNKSQEIEAPTDKQNTLRSRSKNHLSYETPSSRSSGSRDDTSPGHHGSRGVRQVSYQNDNFHRHDSHDNVITKRNERSILYLMSISCNIYYILYLVLYTYIVYLVSCTQIIDSISYTIHTFLCFKNVFEWVFVNIVSPRSLFDLPKYPPRSKAAN